MMPTAVLGIDPGGRFVGLAVVLGSELERARVLDRRRLTPTPTRREWVAHVLATVDEAAAALTANGYTTRLAVEDVRPPNPHMRRADGNSLTNLDGILDTAVLVGALLAAWPDLALVDPAGHGNHPDGAYPVTIRKGTRGLGGPPGHARSAYDVARAAAWQFRTIGAPA